MKKMISVGLVMLMLLAFAGCGIQKSVNPTGPTGMAAQIEQPHIWYNGGLYAYDATGFDEKLPDGYELAGQVIAQDNTKLPAEEFCGCQVEAGQNIYANTAHQENIYVEYEHGCAAFALKNAE